LFSERQEVKLKQRYNQSLPPARMFEDVFGSDLVGLNQFGTISLSIRHQLLRKTIFQSDFGRLLASTWNMQTIIKRI